jgi:hypothetical protein
MKRLVLGIVMLVISSPARAQEPVTKTFRDFAVWRKMEGLWRGDLSYYKGDGSYSIHPYNALFRIRYDGASYHQQNWMFYPPGSAQAAWLSRGLAKPDEGVEMTVNNWGRMVDNKGTMITEKIDHLFDFIGGERTDVIDEDVVIYRYISPDSGVMQHLQMVNMAHANRRTRTAQGFDANRFVRDPLTQKDVIDPATGQPTPNPNLGLPRAFSAYREVRIADDQLEAVRAEWRRKYNVKVFVSAGPTPADPSRIERTDVAITDCDRLANHPFDPDRVTGGVAQEKVEIDKAVVACRAAVKAEPTTARFQYQLGRALFYGKRYKEARPFLERAALVQDYRQAQFVLGLLHYEPQGYEQDRCKSAMLWRRAAMAGHPYSQYQFPQAVQAGAFKGCGTRQDPAELLGFVRAVKPLANVLGVAKEVANLEQFYAKSASEGAR